MLLLAGLWAGVPAALHAQTLNVISLAEHEQRLPQLREAVNRCLQNPAQCTTAATVADESFHLANGVQTHVNYVWLRNGIGALAKAKPADRQKLADGLLVRLQSTPGDLQPSAVPAAKARSEADAVLSQVEFAKAKPGILQQQWDRITDWLDRHLSQGSTLREAGPWLRILLELALFGVPLLLLGLWLLRQVREDRLRPRSPGREAEAVSRDTSWADVAQAHARAGEWRDAVHALYWHSITGFEQRRVWSAVRNRTPREYLRLLEAGSRRRTLLRELTLLLEHVWYGHGSAAEADFDRAQLLTEELAAV